MIGAASAHQFIKEELSGCAGSTFDNINGIVFIGCVWGGPSLPARQLHKELKFFKAAVVGYGRQRHHPSKHNPSYSTQEDKQLKFFL